MVTAEHKVKYLRHAESGHIVTSQHKAWNDTVRMCLWVDLILKPAKDNREGKILLWMDNCSCHVTDIIEQRMQDAGIEVAKFPPNMTAVLQVLDLVVNGPLKRHIRSWTADEICAAFERYRERWRNMERGIGKFRAPKIKVGVAMEKFFQLVKTGEFAQDEFAQTIRESFVECGLTPCNAVGEATRFRKFNSAKLSGCAKYIPSSAGDVDYSVNAVQLPNAGQQQAQVEALVNQHLLGNFDEDDDGEGMDDDLQ